MNHPIERRRFLVLGGGGLVTLACAGCGQNAATPATTAVPAGNVKDVAENSLTLVAANHSVALGRDTGGLFALSTVCTHAQCPMDPVNNTIAGGFSCGCHGSTFSGDGAVTHGPANSPLPHYQVDTDASGAITVRADLPEVAAAARTPIS